MDGGDSYLNADILSTPDISAHYPTQDTPADIDDSIIHALQQLDLQTKKNVLSSWSQGKRRPRNFPSHHTGTNATLGQYDYPQSPLPVETIVSQPKPPVSWAQSINDLLDHPDCMSHLDSHDVDGLIQYLERNKRSYEQWLERKARESNQQKSARLAEATREKVELQKTAAKEQQRKQSSQKRLAQWLYKKEIERLQADAKSRKDLDMEQIVAAKRQEQNKKAFTEWCQQQKMKKRTIDVKGHTQLGDKKMSDHLKWVDIHPESAQISSSSRSGRQHPKHPGRKAIPLLSPPNLYQDYARCKLLVPDYIRKYGVQVASGGMGLAMDQFIDNGVATLAPSKSTTAPKNVNTAKRK
ncbi:hypothetical protein BSLG_001081 [Batrachochytrium salamandrivorans]|nr:hypothetical protein BSLG_001081 [Batrachochytrium salamandrivorans]